VSRPNARLASLRWAAFALVALSVPHPAAAEEKPDLIVRASPRASIAPGGRMQKILISAEIVGPEVERYYCPEVTWVLPNGLSSVESDCDPFEERQHYPRHFMRWIRSPPRQRNYQVCVELSKSGTLFDSACVRYLVR
jgi:hypothetical protein